MKENSLEEQQTVSLEKYYLDYFNPANKRINHNWLINASMGCGKTFNLINVVKSLTLTRRDLIIYSAPTTHLRHEFATKTDGYEVIFTDPVMYESIDKSNNRVRSVTMEYIIENNLNIKHEDDTLLNQRIIACTHASLLRGRMAKFLDSQSNALANKRITLIIDESFHEEVVSTVLMKLSEFKILGLNPLELKKQYRIKAQTFESQKKKLAREKNLTEDDFTMIDILNRLDTIIRMDNFEISEDFNQGDIQYSFLGRLDMKFLSNQPNINFLVLDACGEKALTEHLIGIEVHKVIDFRPEVDWEKVSIEFRESDTSMRRASTAKETLTKRQADYMRYFEEANAKLASHRRQHITISGITNKDLADRMNLKGHFRNVAGKNLWEFNNFLIIYGVYLHAMDDLKLKAATFVGLSREDFDSVFEFDWLSLQYRCVNPYYFDLSDDMVSTLDTHFDEGERHSVDLKAITKLLNAFVLYFYRSIYTQTVGRIRYHRYIFNPSADPISIIVVAPQYYMDIIKVLLPPELLK